ncbi:hypothetical protein B296_00006533 [Ensete ventricosum]|uniref:Uncharacterized protein n=1 Tax=Ensete ventricosum TaxID=4639 RepID=A0A426ZTN4_ENSVE|nr:hypothetical protein B296_00006533 [Ensete ventricosum]
MEEERQHFRAKEAGEDGQHSEEGLEILNLKKSPGSRLPATKPPLERRGGEATRKTAILGSPYRVRSSCSCARATDGENFRLVAIGRGPDLEIGAARRDYAAQRVAVREHQVSHVLLLEYRHPRWSRPMRRHTFRTSSVNDEQVKMESGRFRSTLPAMVIVVRTTASEVSPRKWSFLPEAAAESVVQPLSDIYPCRCGIRGSGWAAHRGCRSIVVTNLSNARGTTEGREVEVEEGDGGQEAAIPPWREDRGPHGVFGGKEGEDVVRQAAEGSVEA